ncbi:TolC family outer membrane protein [Defluviimonas sp. D31]|uniref:TolC family outer membrane protein n=1 Tax=Defluviimonas sp. D31 TaxID=3083253 RepID=UPI00296FB5D3|nr:TolC family outer membrane protein [Defluviimonas sp. D31]MDW4549491.1 TolC family outer membrane protein [Defluviimonas sp. D31]
MTAGLTALSLVAAAPAWAETLADALIAAYRNSNIIEQNRAVLRAADEDVATAVSTLRPVAAWALDVGYTNDVLNEGLASFLGLNAQWTLFDFGRNRTGIDIAKETVLATRQSLIGAEQDVLLEAVRAYFVVRGQVENVAINENSVRVLTETLRAAQDQFDVGEVTRTDVAQAEARLAAARAGLAAAERELAVAREDYRAATGQYPGSLAAAPRGPALPRTLDDARVIAQRTHPSIRQAQFQARAADLQVTLAAAERMPTIVGRASIGIDEDGDDASGVGVELNQTFYAGGRLSSLHRKAIAQRDAARSVLLQSSVIVVRELGTAWAEIEVANAQISAADLEIEAATIAYEGVREEAKLGARTTLDVLDAEQELLDARGNRISAEARYQIAIYALLSSMGLLTAEQLGLGVPIYDPEGYYNAVKSAPLTSVQGESLDRVMKAIGRN